MGDPRGRYGRRREQDRPPVKDRGLPSVESLRGPDVRGPQLPYDLYLTSRDTVAFTDLFILFHQVLGKQGCNLAGWKFLYILEFPSNGS